MPDVYIKYENSARENCDYRVGSAKIPYTTLAAYTDSAE